MPEIQYDMSRFIECRIPQNDEASWKSYENDKIAIATTRIRAQVNYKNLRNIPKMKKKLKFFIDLIILFSVLEITH